MIAKGIIAYKNRSILNKYKWINLKKLDKLSYEKFSPGKIFDQPVKIVTVYIGITCFDREIRTNSTIIAS